MRVKKNNNILTMDKTMESSKETQFEAKLTMVSLSEYAGLKHRLINVDAAPVLIRPAWKQPCFNVCYIHVSISQDKKLLLMLPV